MPAWLKLLTGLAATGLASDGWYMFNRQDLLATLGAETIPVFMAHGVTDARVDWQSPAGWTYRTARITGTASAATRAAVTTEIAALPGIHAVEWQAE